MREVFDPLRMSWVRATPEEVVRQTWIHRMVEELDYPKELLAVEKELKALPHLESEVSLPLRRIDLLSFMKSADGIKPLLLVECKESELTQEAMDQAISYNHYVKAPFVAIVNASQIRFRSNATEMSWLPSYHELIKALYG